MQESTVDKYVISVMLAVENTGEASDWYAQMLGATLLWRVGPFAGLALPGAFLFLGEPDKSRWDSPVHLGTVTARVELFCDDPDQFIQAAIAGGAKEVAGGTKDHQRPWGLHRQGGFTDPFGHVWLVGDRSPLKPFP